MLISAWFGYSQTADMPWHGALVGIVASLVIATPIMLFEIKGERRVLRRLRRLPLPAYLGLKIAFYLVVILGGLCWCAACTSPSHERFDDDVRRLADLRRRPCRWSPTWCSRSAAAGLRHAQEPADRPLRAAQARAARLPADRHEGFDRPGRAAGAGAVPRAAERLLPRRRRRRARMRAREIHKYVGDEAILTWPGDRALADGDCLRCPFVARDLIARQRRALPGALRRGAASSAPRCTTARSSPAKSATCGARSPMSATR